VSAMVGVLCFLHIRNLREKRNLRI
jgi:hypothetical protein